MVVLNAYTAASITARGPNFISITRSSDAKVNRWRLNFIVGLFIWFLIHDQPWIKKSLSFVFSHDGDFPVDSITVNFSSYEIRAASSLWSAEMRKVVLAIRKNVERREWIIILKEIIVLKIRKKYMLWSCFVLHKKRFQINYCWRVCCTERLKLSPIHEVR